MKEPKMPNTDIALVETDLKPRIAPSEWTEPCEGEGRYSPNQMIGAYNLGTADGLRKAYEEAFARIVENAEKAGVHTSQIINHLRTMGFHPESARLNPVAPAEMRVMIIVPPEEYFSDRFMDVYSLVTALEASWADEGSEYSVSFQFCYGVESLNIAALRADGYIQEHRSLRDEHH